MKSARWRMVVVGTFIFALVVLGWWAGFLNKNNIKFALGICPLPGRICTSICRGAPLVVDKDCPRPECFCTQRPDAGSSTNPRH